MSLKKDSIYTLLACLIGMIIAAYEISPIIFDNTVVQDDFRQSFFWVWQYWDPSLFQNSLLVDIYQAHLVRTPLLNLIFKSGPFFTDDLIFFAKALAFVISVLSSLFAYLFFYRVSKDRFLALVYTALMTVIFWSTDHVPNACTRAFIWLGLYAFMYFKDTKQDLKAAITCFLALMLSPFTFLLCLAMEFWDLAMHKFSKAKLITFFSLGLNSSLVAFMYLYLFKDIKTMAAGETFSLAELKTLAEFNEGGRHPIFAGAQEGWLNSLHWGLPLREAAPYVLAAVAILAIVTYLFFKSKPELLKSSLSSTAAMLFYASISLYLAAVVTFPLLFMPNRYIAIPWFLLVIFSAFMLLKKLTNNKIIYTVPLIVIALLFNIAPDLKHPGFIKAKSSIINTAKELPKDSLIASHPSMNSFEMIPVLARRSIFVDRERSIAYSKKHLYEIRRRTKESFRMLYASSKEELDTLMLENGVTHFLAHKMFYKPNSLKAKYMEPYNDFITELIESQKEQGFYLQQLLENHDEKFLFYSR